MYLGFFDKHGCTYWCIKKNLTHCKHVPCNTLTHSTNEDLFNIKRKGDPKSRTSDTTETRNPCVIKVILLACFTYILIFLNLLNLFWHTDKNFCFYVEINTCTFPDKLKIAQVVPIPKKNSTLLKGNYRPVSILPKISKKIERAIEEQLVKNFDLHFNIYLSAF